MLEQLPQEVVISILLKLPIKTLLLCTCISKSWLSLITNPSFIKTHLNQNNNKNHLLLLRRCCYSTGLNKKEERYSLHFNTESLTPYQELKYPFGNSSDNLKIIGFCNGLLCLSGNSHIILWNPSIQKYISVPLPSDIFTTYNGTPYKSTLGFGFDSKKSDFKLVRLIYPQRGVTETAFSSYVELYELSTNSWSVITSSLPCEMVNSQSTAQAFLNGSVHWIGFTNDHKGFRFQCMILRFDMEEDEFSVKELPDSLVHESPENLKVTILGGELAVLQCGWYMFGNRYVSSIWMVRKGGGKSTGEWRKVVSVDPSLGLGMVLGCRGNNGDVLMMTSRNGEVVLYKPEERYVKGIGIRGGEDSFYLDEYGESLVLLDQGKGVVGFEGEEEGESSDGEEER